MSHILIETRDRVMRIEIARPDKKNALTLDMYAAMADALAAADGDAAVRVVLIHGARDCFTAGNDLKDFLDRPPHSETSPTTRFLRGIANFGKPLLAAVNGAAVGIGTTMLLHCDLGQPFDADKAYAAGFVTAIVAEKELLERARAGALAIAALPPAAVRATKALMRGRIVPRVSEAMTDEGRVFSERLSSPEAREAMTAFFEKRKPDFSRF